MSFELNPKEVLMHLHEMGYYNITPEKLKEFIRDLKKLIKHDAVKNKLPSQNKCIEDSTSSTLPNTTDESLSPSPHHASNVHRKHRHRHNSGGVLNKNIEDISCSSSDSSVSPSKKVLRECTKLVDQRNKEKSSKESAKPSKPCDCALRKIGCKCYEEDMAKQIELIKISKSKENLVPPRPRSTCDCGKRPIGCICCEENLAKEKEFIKSTKLKENLVPPRPKASCDCAWKRIGCKCCEEKWAKEIQSIKSTKSKENLDPPRPKSSFIKTSRMTGYPHPGSAPQRCDPVKLYHKYKKEWMQQKMPGENNHNELRWTIREKMAQEPHPRPLSQASSLTSISRHRKRL